jgi:diguanylate cyclase (GGDEF)-like protein
MNKLNPPALPRKLTATQTGLSRISLETKWSATTVFTIAMVMLGVIGFLDHATGSELRISSLYIVPVALVSWKLGFRAGICTILLGMMVWVTSIFYMGLRLPIWSWVINALAQFVAFAVVLSLVVSLQKSRAAERNQARTDSLTGLLNIRAFYEKAATELERQWRYPHPVTLAFIDLDGFKAVNDRFGHQVGDQALVTVGNTLRTATRATDVISRLGGDEFALLLPETDLEGARQILQRVHSTVAQKMMANTWPVTCSIGAVTFDVPPESVDIVISAADQLMYRVKESGKNAVRIEPFSSDQTPGIRS